MVIIETTVFTRHIQELMNDQDYSELQEVLVNRPDTGDLIPGSGGLRKVRWGLEECATNPHAVCLPERKPG